MIQTPSSAVLARLTLIAAVTLAPGYVLGKWFVLGALAQASIHHSHYIVRR